MFSHTEAVVSIPEITQMINKHMKICSASLVLREMLTEILLHTHYDGYNKNKMNSKAYSIAFYSMFVVEPILFFSHFKKDICSVFFPEHQKKTYNIQRNPKIK